MSEEVAQEAVNDFGDTQADVEKAQAQGWNPDYDGPNKRSAKEFNERGEQMAPILKERNDQLFGEIKRLQTDLQEFRGMHEKTLNEAREESYKRALHDLKQQQRQAVEDADTDKFEQVERQIGALEAKKPAAPQPQVQAGPSPEFVAWQQQNTWYGSDHELTSDADIVGATLAQKNPHLTGVALVEEVKKKLVKMHGPERFGMEKKPKPEPAVETGGSKPRAKGGKLAGNLPPEAKAAADKFVKQGLFKDHEEYAKVYFGDK